MRVWRIKTGDEFYWPQWKDDQVIAVGWSDLDVEDGTDPAQLDKPTLKSKIADRYDEENLGHAAGHIKSIAGTHWEDDSSMRVGDVAIVTAGDENPYDSTVVLAVAKLGEYNYNPDGVGNTAVHTYQREVTDWLYGGPEEQDDQAEPQGPVAYDNLPDKFTSNDGKCRVWPGGTRDSAGYGEEADAMVTELVDCLEDADNERIQDTRVKPNKERPVQRYIKEHEDMFFDDSVTFAREFPIERGDDGVRLNMLYENDSSGNDIIVEIKRWQAEEEALDQLQRQISKYTKVKDRDARGYLMAQSFTSEVKNQVQDSPNIELKRFEVKLRPADTA